MTVNGKKKEGKPRQPKRIKEAGQDEPHTQKPYPDPPVKMISQVKGKIRCLGKVNPRTENPPSNKDEGQHRIIADYSIVVSISLA